MREAVVASKPPNYEIVKQLLQGKLTLAEATVLRSVSQVTRALIVQAVVLSAPETFLKKPYEGLILNQGITELISDVFGSDMASNILYASRSHGLHRRQGASGVQLLVPPELRVLVERYGHSKSVKPILAAVNRRSNERAAAHTAGQHKVELTARYLIGVLTDAELVALVQKLQGYVERTSESRT